MRKIRNFFISARHRNCPVKTKTPATQTNNTFLPFPNFFVKKVGNLFDYLIFAPIFAKKY